MLIECLSLHFTPTLSPAILYITSTLFVVFCFVCTPYIVFNSVQREKYAQKSLRDKAYMRRLFIIEILNVFFIPFFIDSMLDLYIPGYR